MFKALFKINNSLQLSLFSAIVVEIVSGLQIFHFILQIMASTFNKNQVIFLALHKLVPFLSGAIQIAQSPLYSSLIKPIWITSLFYLAFHLATIGIVFWFRKSINSQAHTLTTFVAYLYHFHSRLIFYPLQLFYLTVINLIQNESWNNLKGFFQSEVNLLIPTITMCIINILIGLTKEFVLYQINHEKNFSSCKTNLYHQMLFIYKAIALAIYPIIINERVCLQIISILNSLAIYVLLHILYSKLPFYNFQVLKVSVIETSVTFAFSIISIVQMFAENEQLLNGVHILSLVLSAFLSKIILNSFKALFTKIAEGEFSSPEHSIHFALLFHQLITTNGKPSNFDNKFLPSAQLLTGVVKKNNISISELKRKGKKEEQYDLIYKFVLEKLGHTLNSNPNSKVLLIFMAESYLEKLNNNAKAFELIRRVESQCSFIPVKSSIESFYHKLWKLHKQDDIDANIQLEFSNYFKYNEIAGSIKYDMLQEVEKHLEFWQDLHKNSLDLKKFFQKAEDIDSLMLKIHKQYETRFEDFRTNLPAPILMYAVYLNNIRQDPHEATQVLQKYQILGINENNIENKTSMNSWTNAVVVVSINSQKFGEIIDASGSIQNLFNVKKADLIGNNFGCLFPTAIARHYQSILSQYSRASSLEINFRDLSYGKMKNGDIFELESQFRLYPYLNREMAVIILLKILSNPKSVIIARGNGGVVDCSKDLETKINSSFNNLKTIQELSADFERINLAFNITYNSQDDITLISGKTPKARIKDNKGTVITNVDASDDSTVGFNSLNQPSSDPKKSFGYSKTMSYKDSKDFITFKTYQVTYPEKRNSIGQSKMNAEEAQKICNKFMTGEKVALKTSLLGSSNKTKQSKAYIKIKPYMIEGEVYKIIIFQNNKLYLNAPEQSPDEQSQSDIANSNFADEFSVASERKHIVKQLTTTSKEMKSVVLENEMIALSSHHGSSSIQGKLVNFRKEADRIEHLKKVQIEDQRSSVMGIKYKETLLIKTLKEVSNKKATHPLIRLFFLILYMVILIVGILAAVNFHISMHSIEEVEKGITIVNVATMRLQSTIKIWQWSLCLYGSITGVRPYSGFILEAIQYLVKDEVPKMAAHNSKLKTELSTIREADLLQTTFLKNVEMWIPSEGNTTNLLEVDTFVANDILVGKYLAIAKLENLTQLTQGSDGLFTMNNTANDFLVSSKILISETENLLETIINKNISLLQLVLSLETVALVMVVTVFIVFLILSIQMYRRLFKALTRIEENSIIDRITEIQKIKVLFTEDIETRSFSHNALALFEDLNPAQRAKVPRRARSASKKKKLLLKNMNFSLIKLILQALIFIPLFILLFTFTLNNSLVTFKSFEQINNQVSVLSQSSYQGDLFLTSLLYDITFYNQTDILLYNRLPQQQLAINLEEVIKINQRVEKIFFSGENEVDPKIETSLKIDACTFLPSNFETTCEQATRGAKTGLMAVTQFYLQGAINAINLFHNNPTLDVGRQTLMDFGDSATPHITLQLMVFPSMVSYILEKFSKAVDDALGSQKLMFCLVCGLIVSYLLYLHFVCFKKFRYVERSRRKILKVLPYTLIQENRALSFYLITDFKKEIQRIKNLL